MLTQAMPMITRCGYDIPGISHTSYITMTYQVYPTHYTRYIAHIIPGISHTFYQVYRTHYIFPHANTHKTTYYHWIAILQDCDTQFDRGDQRRPGPPKQTWLCMYQTKPSRMLQLSQPFTQAKTSHCEHFVLSKTRLCRLVTATSPRY